MVDAPLLAQGNQLVMNVWQSSVRRDREEMMLNLVAETASEVARQPTSPRAVMALSEIVRAEDLIDGPILLGVSMSAGSQLSVERDVIHLEDESEQQSAEQLSTNEAREPEAEAPPVDRQRHSHV